MKSEVSQPSRLALPGLGALRTFVEQFGIHLLLEVSAVSLLERVLSNTALSLLVGITIVEGCHLLWRRWRQAWGRGGLQGQRVLGER